MAKTQAQVAKEFIDYRFNEVEKKLNRIEQKMDGFQFAKQSEVDSLSGKISSIEDRITVAEQKLKPIEKIYYLVLGTLVTGIIGLGFFLIQKAIQ